MTSVSSVSVEDKIEEERKEAPADQYLLVQDEVWRVVSDAARSGAGLPLGSQAHRIETVFPTSGCSRQDIKDALVFAAVDAGVAVEVDAAARTSVPTIELSSIFAVIGRGRRKKRRSKGPAEVDALLQAAG